MLPWSGPLRLGWGGEINNHSLRQRGPPVLDRKLICGASCSAPFRSEQVVLFISRRNFCGAGAASLLSPMLMNSARAFSVNDKDQSGVVNQHETLDRSGNDLLDRAMISFLRKITAILDINPGFK